MPVCDNCRAEVPKVHPVSDGRQICCASCVFNPLGCRCKFGELGVAEWQDWEDYDEEAEMQEQDAAESADEELKSARQIKRWHDHLDSCARCRNKPFDLCREGVEILTQSE